MAESASAYLLAYVHVSVLPTGRASLVAQITKSPSQRRPSAVSGNCLALPSPGNDAMQSGRGRVFLVDSLQCFFSCALLVLLTNAITTASGGES